MPENQTAWNSDNQGVKETFTQTGRREETGSQTERTCSKAVDHRGEAGLAEQEYKDLKLALNYCRGCHGWEELPVSHKRFHWKVGLEQSKLVTFSPL